MRILFYSKVFHALSRKLFSALVSSSFKNLPSCCGSHSLPEPVNLASLSLLGLVCSFHNLPLKITFDFLKYLTYYIIKKTFKSSVFVAGKPI